MNVELAFLTHSPDDRDGVTRIGEQDTNSVTTKSVISLIIF
jgi:hypothetical protein